MMKKILFLLFTCSIIFTFAGCSSSKKDYAEATTTQKIATTASNTENPTTSSASDSDTQKDSYDFSVYKKRIKKLTRKVNNAKSSSNASVNEKRFYSLKKELDLVDDELDHLDDEFEHAYENDTLSFKVYKSREKTIEKLENQLDLLEDALENKFGIDD